MIEWVVLLPVATVIVGLIPLPILIAGEKRAIKETRKAVSRSSWFTAVYTAVYTAGLFGKSYESEIPEDCTVTEKVALKRRYMEGVAERAKIDAKYNHYNSTPYERDEEATIHYRFTWELRQGKEAPSLSITPWG